RCLELPMTSQRLVIFFFFQAEDGIRDRNVTGVQTCALPISPAEKRHQYSLSDEDVLTLAEYAIKIEKHYSERAGEPRPMDMEWARDGDDGLLYMVQARPETVASQSQANVLEDYSIKGEGKVIVTGRAVGSKIGTGKVRVARDLSQMHEFQEGDVLVSDTTTPDWEPVMKKASAIVTNRGGRTCHAA